jgi:hypothetical protein
MDRMTDYMTSRGADEEDDDEEADESPARVCTVATSDALAATATSASASDANAAADAASEVAAILREQHRREAKSKTTPVQSTSTNARRRELGRLIAG